MTDKAHLERPVDDANPDYYRTQAIEKIDAMRSEMPPEAFIAGCIMQASQYLGRYYHSDPKKGGPLALQKAVWFLRMAYDDDPRNDSVVAKAEKPDWSGIMPTSEDTAAAVVKGMTPEQRDFMAQAIHRHNDQLPRWSCSTCGRELAGGQRGIAISGGTCTRMVTGGDCGEPVMSHEYEPPVKPYEC